MWVQHWLSHKSQGMAFELREYLQGTYKIAYQHSPHIDSRNRTCILIEYESVLYQLCPPSLVKASQFDEVLF